MLVPFCASRQGDNDALRRSRMRGQSARMKQHEPMTALSIRLPACVARAARRAVAPFAAWRLISFKDQWDRFVGGDEYHALIARSGTWSGHFRSSFRCGRNERLAALRVRANSRPEQVQQKVLTRSPRRHAAVSLSAIRCLWPWQF
jgi:hypothetical protein